MKLKDRARDKAERRAARKTQVRDTKGPEIAWDQPGGPEGSPPVVPAPPIAATPPPDPTDVDP